MAFDNQGNSERGHDLLVECEERDLRGKETLHWSPKGVSGMGMSGLYDACTGGRRPHYGIRDYSIICTRGMDM